MPVNDCVCHKENLIKTSFSILTLLVIVTIAALSVALYSANSTALTTQRQLDELTDKTGLIPIDDPSMVYVRPLHRPAPMVFTYQLAIPATKQFKLLVGEGVGDSIDILCSNEISGPASGFSHPPQRTISIYVRETAVGWYVGYVNAGGSGSRLVANKHFNWMEHIDKVSISWNPPPSVQRRVESYTADETIRLLSVDENDRRAFPPNSKKAIDNPRRFEIWLEPIDSGN